MRLLFVLNDAHNPINNPTVHIADMRKQNTLLPGNSTTDRRTISHHDGDICFNHNDTFQQYIPRGIMPGALFCPIWQIFPVWFHCTMFRLCCFRWTTVLENCHSDTLHHISRHKLTTVFWNNLCEINFMTRFNQQRCQCFTVWWEFRLLNSVQ